MEVLATNYIRSVSFGGYDKADVKNRLNYLYTQLHDTKNELREIRQMVSESDKSKDIRKSCDTVLSSERAKLTMLQVQNDSLNDELSENKNRYRELSDENKKLKCEIEQLRSKMADMDIKIKAAKTSSSVNELLSDACKSADAIISDAKKRAAETEALSKKLVQDMIDEANTDAEKIIKNAESEADARLARVKTDNEQLKTAAKNIRTEMTNDIQQVRDNIAVIRSAFEAVFSTLAEAETTLDSAGSDLAGGKIPLFEDQNTASEDTAVKQGNDEMMTDKKKDIEKQQRQTELDNLLAIANSLKTNKGDHDG